MDAGLLFETAVNMLAWNQFGPKFPNLGRRSSPGLLSNSAGIQTAVIGQ